MNIVTGNNKEMIEMLHGRVGDDAVPEELVCGGEPRH